MRTAMVEYNVYRFNELSAEAKEKVKQWYLDGRESYIFTDDVKEDLCCLFGKNDLDVQYSLSYCQGDGLNIYGEVDAKSIIDCLENHNGGTQLAEFENVLTEKEKKTILNYASQCGKIKLPYNNHYCYCIADRINLAEEWEYDLENYSHYKNIDFDLLNKFEKLVVNIFLELCGSYEQQGYKYFYEISDEELEEACEANDYEFLANGKIF